MKLLKIHSKNNRAEKRKHTQKRRYVFAATLMIIATFTQVQSAFAVGSTLNYYSPTSSMSELYRENGTTPYRNPSGNQYTNVTNHLLLNSNHGVVHSIKLGLYYPKQAASYTQQEIKIFGNHSFCDLDGASKVENNDALAQITFQGGKAKKTFPVTKRGFCGGLDKSKTNRTGGFYKNYSVYGGIIDQGGNNDTGYNKVTMTIEFSPIVLDSRYGDYLGCTQASCKKTKETQFSFGVMSPDHKAKIGNINTSESRLGNPNNSLVAKDGSPQPGNITATYTFGLTCDIDRAQEREVAFYDADNGLPFQPRDMTFYIQKQSYSGSWTTIPAGSYRYDSRRKVLNGSFSGNRIKPYDGRNLNTVTKFTMEPQTRYRMIVENFHKRNSGNNFIFVGLPGDSIYGSSDFKCQNYELTPNISINPSDTVQPGQSVSLSPSVNNDGKTNSKDTTWTLERLYFANSSDSVPHSSGGTSSSEPCAYFGKCDPDQSNGSNKQSANRKFAPGTTNPGNKSFTIPDNAKIGSKYCFAVSVKPYAHNKDSWKHSAPECVVVGVKPRVHMLGYDTRVGGNIVTSTSQYKDDTYGSWGEYGVFSGGFNKNFASGSGLVNGVRNEQCNWSSVTFANTGAGGCSDQGRFGNYGSIAYPAETVASLASQLCESGNTHDGNYTISGSNTGGTKPICVEGTAKITGNQTYSNVETTDSKIPQRLIIAQNIDIDSSVSNVDAWLIATGVKSVNPEALRSAEGGTVSTCSDEGANATASFKDAKLSSKTCDKKLTVHGPVIAGKMYLLRTYTGDAKPTAAAEVFDLRADSFLWSYQGSSSGESAIAETDAVQELPPRF